MASRTCRSCGVSFTELEFTRLLDQFRPHDADRGASSHWWSRREGARGVRRAREARARRSCSAVDLEATSQSRCARPAMGVSLSSGPAKGCTCRSRTATSVPQAARLGGDSRGPGAAPRRPRRAEGRPRSEVHRGRPRCGTDSRSGPHLRHDARGLSARPRGEHDAADQSQRELGAASRHVRRPRRAEGARRARVRRARGRAGDAVRGGAAETCAPSRSGSSRGSRAKGSGRSCATSSCRSRACCWRWR
jgi:hypothetical protein